MRIGLKGSVSIHLQGKRARGAVGNGHEEAVVGDSKHVFLSL